MAVAGDASAESFEALWAWLCEVEASSWPVIPLVIHSRSGDRTDWGRARQGIRGLPFSRAFLSRTGHQLPTLLREALEDLRPTAADHPSIHGTRLSQWRLVAEVITNGLTDTTACREKLRMSDWTFRMTAASAIRTLRATLERKALDAKP